MLDDAIDLRLKNWATWVLRRESGGLGYPGECPYTRLQARSGSGYVHEIDADAWQTEQAVTRMEQAAPELHLVVHVHYLRTLSEEQKLRACQCARRTFYYRLERAHSWIRKTIDSHCTNPV